MPSIVLGAKTPDGRDVVDARVLVDGNLVTQKLDGKPLEIDPGSHRIRFEPASGPGAEKTWLIRQREKGRLVSVTLGSTKVDESGEPGTRPARSVLPYVLGGVGVVGLGMFTYFGLHGRSIQHDLDDRGCKPSCPKDEADEMDRSYLIANISLGVGLVALGSAGYLYFRERSAAPTTTERRVTVGAGLHRGGAMTSVSGTF